MWIGIVSLFPEMFQSLNLGITGRALKEHLLTLQHWNPRDFTTDSHKTVDDSPYGGGPGMVMMTAPLQKAIHAAKENAPSTPTVIYLTPQGRKFNQEMAVELANKPAVIFVAGRYEGIDERLIQLEIQEEWSIGDYILTGGELAAMVMIDAATRLLPGALHDKNSVLQDSLTTGLLKHPQYTRPENFAGNKVPEVLLGGNHRLIDRWRKKQSLGRTWLRRPDILAQKLLSSEEKILLTEYIDEFFSK